MKHVFQVSLTIPNANEDTLRIFVPTAKGAIANALGFAGVRCFGMRHRVEDEVYVFTVEASDYVTDDLHFDELEDAFDYLSSGDNW